MCLGIGVPLICNNVRLASRKVLGRIQRIVSGFEAVPKNSINRLSHLRVSITPTAIDLVINNLVYDELFRGWFVVIFVLLWFPECLHCFRLFCGLIIGFRLITVVLVV